MTGKETNQVRTIPGLLQTLRLLKSQTGGPIVAMLADWENHRRFTAGDSFPVFDEKNALKTIPQITAEGFRPFFYLSGLNYTFENKGASPSRIPVPDAYLPHFVVDATTRAPKVFSLEETFFSSPWRRDSYAFCVGSPVSRLFFRKMIYESSKLGVSVLQMDQTPSGAGEPCFSGQHDHVPGIGLYQTQGFHALLKDMREYTEQQWYRGSPGAVGIPLFTYLYHEFALVYGGDTLRIGPRETASIPWHVRGHAVNLVTGKTPAAATWLFPDQLLNADPRPIRMIRNHLQLLRAGADRYLMEGRMLHPFEISAPTLTYRFMLYDFGAPFSLDFTESSVLTSSWQAPDGGVGHVFVNLAQTKQELEVDLDTRNAPCGISATRFSIVRREGIALRRCGKALRCRANLLLFLRRRRSFSSSCALQDDRGRRNIYKPKLQVRTPGDREIAQMAVREQRRGLCLLGAPFGQSGGVL